jgi:hypothetical protein
LPTLWFRNPWSWHGAAVRPVLQGLAGTPVWSVIKVVEAVLGERYLYCEGEVPLLFTENETNTQRIFGVPNRSPSVKDSLHNHVVHGLDGVVNPDRKGTKAAAHYRVTIGPGESRVIRLRLSEVSPDALAGGNGNPASPFGASHQTGWTGVVARLLHVFGTATAEQLLAAGKGGYAEAAAQAASASPARDVTSPVG